MVAVAFELGPLFEAGADPVPEPGPAVPAPVA